MIGRYDSGVTLAAVPDCELVQSGARDSGIDMVHLFGFTESANIGVAPSRGTRRETRRRRRIHRRAWENTKIDTALISSGFSVSSNAGMTPRRPLTTDS